MRKEIMLAGFGGQGIVKAALLLATAAGLFENREVAQTQSYGPEARGGACRAEVVISDQEIAYIKTRNLDSLVVMSQPAMDKYGHLASPENTLVIHDSTLVTSGFQKFHRSYAVNATSMAEEELGRSLFANIIMLGALAGAAGIVGMEALSQALEGNVPPETLKANLRALDLGYQSTRQRKPAPPLS